MINAYSIRISFAKSIKGGAVRRFLIKIDEKTRDRRKENIKTEQEEGGSRGGVDDMYEHTNTMSYQTTAKSIAKLRWLGSLWRNQPTGSKF